jgi:predicted esterase
MPQMSLDKLEAREDEPGIQRSQAYFHSLIKAEIEKGIPSDRIVLGGFSQGGAMALLSGVTSSEKLGGIFGLSSYLLLREKLRDMIPANSPNKDVPIFMGHGDSDPVVQYKWGELSAEELTNLGWKVDFKTYR